MIEVNQTHQNWQQLSQQTITAIKFNLVDRLFLLLEIAKYVEQDIYFWNSGYEYLQTVNVEPQLELVTLSPSQHLVSERVIKICQELDRSAVFVLEGFGRVEPQLSYQLRNFYFRSQSRPNNTHQIILVDEIIQIPEALSSLIPILEYKTPDLDEIREILLNAKQSAPELIQACVGLSRGEIKILLENQAPTTTKRVLDYKTQKLAGRGLRIVPEPDLPDVGGLDLLERDLQKIKKLFTPEAAARGLRPPKGCLLWGLPGTGKSLVSKMMSQKLNATLISCDWNQLLDSDLVLTLANLQYVLDLVDRLGNCVLFFDEFEKAFAGWNSEINGGILTKMAGKLLTWMQEHQSPSIMLATINHLELLPPELIRRFQYIWFFPSELHNGAMWSVFQLHLSKHFPGYHHQFSDSQWRQLFLNYRGCSPAEIAAAVERTHDELFFTNRHFNLDKNVLLAELLAERTRFKPAITNKTTSNALAKILLHADFARPVRSEDRSRFAVPAQKLFEEVKPEQQYSSTF